MKGHRMVEYVINVIDLIKKKLEVHYQGAKGEIE